MPRAASAAGFALVIRPAELTQEQARRHVARDGFAQAFGLLRALAFGAVQGFEFLFLLFELLDHGLHGSGHERRGIVAARGLRGRTCWRF